MKTEDLERAILENSFNWGYGEGDGLVDLNTKVPGEDKRTRTIHF